MLAQRLHVTVGCMVLTLIAIVSAVAAAVVGTFLFLKHNKAKAAVVAAVEQKVATAVDTTVKKL